MGLTFHEFAYKSKNNCNYMLLCIVSLFFLFFTNILNAFVNKILCFIVICILSSIFINNLINTIHLNDDVRFYPNVVLSYVTSALLIFLVIIVFQSLFY